VTLVVAHRGASAVAPENTLEAFEKAIELGADMVEFDVRRAADGALVVSHDAVDATTARELPRVAEVVDLCAGRIALDVELKEPGLEEEALRLLERDFVVTSFIDEVVATVKRLRPDVRTGLLLGAETPLDERIDARQHAAGADFLAPHVSLLDAGLRGEALVVWTVNDELRLRRYLTDRAVAAVVTDDAALAVRINADLRR
jgi:glycerophosphoryl diester phosphodiesterase